MDKLTYDDWHTLTKERLNDIIKQLAKDYQFFPILVENKNDPFAHRVESATEIEFLGQLESFTKAKDKYKLAKLLDIFAKKCVDLEKTKGQAFREKELDNINVQLNGIQKTLVNLPGSDPEQLENRFKQLSEQLNTLKLAYERKPHFENDNRKKLAKMDLSGLPKFHGNLNEKIEDWLFIIKNYQRREEVPDNKMIPSIAPLLRDSALQLLKKFQKDDGTNMDNWKSFRELLIKTYLKENSQRKLRRQLRELRQRGNIDEYVHKFLDSSNQINGMTEDDWYIYLLMV